VIGFVSVLLVLLEARLVFHVPIRAASLLLLAAGCAVAFSSHSRSGTLISARTSLAARRDDGRDDGDDAPTQTSLRLHLPAREHAASTAVVANIVPAKWFVIIARRDHLKEQGCQCSGPRQLVLVTMALVLMAALPRSFSARLHDTSPSDIRSFRRHSDVLRARGAARRRDRPRSCRSSSCRLIQLLVLSNATTFAIPRDADLRGRRLTIGGACRATGATSMSDVGVLSGCTARPRHPGARTTRCCAARQQSS